MKEELQLVQYPRKPGKKSDLNFMNLDHAKKVQKFHSGFPVYQKTPLTELRETAKMLGLGTVYIKDESYRFGLNAFKVLGGSYAIGRCLAERLGKSIEEMSYEELVSDQTRKKLGDITFVTATDGNHGRGVDCKKTGAESRGLHAQRKCPGASGPNPRRRGPGLHHRTELRRSRASGQPPGRAERLGHGSGHRLGRL